MLEKIRNSTAVIIDILTIAMIILAGMTINTGRSYPNLNNKLTTIENIKEISIESKAQTTQLKIDTEQSESYLKSLKTRQTTKNTPVTIKDDAKTQITKQEYNLLKSKTLAGQKTLTEKIDKNISIMYKIMLTELVLVVIMAIVTFKSYVETKKKYAAVCEAIEQLEDLKNKMESEETGI